MNELVIKTKVQPKPTRAEIIDALTQLEIQRRNDESKKQVERKREIHQKLTDQIKRLKLNDPSPYIHFGYVREKKVDSMYIKYSIENIPEPMEKMLLEYHSLPSCPREHRFCDVRKEIYASSQGLACGTRVTRLLDDKESRKALEAMLDAITK